MNRRLALKLFAATSLSRVENSCATTGDEILELDCVDLLARIHDGSVRAEDVCAKYLQQYERRRSLNALTWIDPSSVLLRARSFDQARAKGARLPVLAGLPILVKDNIDTIGSPTSAGTPSLRGHFPRRSAPVVERLMQNGAIIMGKSNMHELSCGVGVTSSNPTFGFVRNPYDPSLVAGGSSGGSAAAVAARIVPAALGTDTGGSVRIPAAYCGIVGFRPSVRPRKLYAQQGVVPLSLDVDTIGPMGRSVADVAMLHATIVGQVPVRRRSLSGSRLGVPRLSYWNDLDPGFEKVAEAALARLRDRGAELVEIDMQEIKDEARRIFITLCSGVIGDLESFLRAQVPLLSLENLIKQVASRDVRAMLETLAQAGAAEDLTDARGVGRDAICSAYRSIFGKHDIRAIVFPTVVLPPPSIRIDGDDLDQEIEFKGRSVAMWIVTLNTVPAAALGAPALSLPAGLTSKGLPVGLEFDGLPGEDEALLELGIAAETAMGRLPLPQPVSRQQP